ncbi:hypothetical protein BV20DRAFT_1114323 [Pilatotrama ljubarskyi]|nr:hypothetical protein BV20DRAFT_1114323 [Pilatotrama ljubarskyi]
MSTPVSQRNLNADGKIAATSPPRPLTIYKAVIAFSNPSLVSQGIRLIARNLSNKGFDRFQLTHKGYDTEGTLEMLLPDNMACSDAARTTADAVQCLPTTVYGTPFIKAHSGAVLLSTEEGVAEWFEINPAGAMWYGNRDLGPAGFEYGSGEGKGFAASVGSQWNGGNGNNNGPQSNANNITTGPQHNGGNGNNNGPQSNNSCWSSGGSQWNGGNGNGNGAQSNTNSVSTGPQWNGGNGNNNGAQSNWPPLASSPLEACDSEITPC